MLQQAAVEDGTYRLARGRDEAVWPTALALFTRLVIDGPSDATNRTASALLALKGRTTDTKEEEEGDIDNKIVGWPWADGNFSWVEPTAWACLALTRAGQGSHPRVADGIRLLLDRTFNHGGINYGNRRIFGIDLEPNPTSTALSLLALQGQEELSAAVPRFRRLSVPTGRHGRRSRTPRAEEARSPSTCIAIWKASRPPARSPRRTHCATPQQAARRRRPTFGQAGRHCGRAARPLSLCRSTAVIRSASRRRSS